MNLRNQRRMAAEVLGVGVHRVWLDPNALDEIADAVTKDDIRMLIKRGLIRKLPEQGTSRARARVLRQKREKGRRRGPGSRKGAKYARYRRKERWMKAIRAVRSMLRELRDRGVIDRRTYRKLYMQAKGGMFRSRAQLRLHLRQMGVEV